MAFCTLVGLALYSLSILAIELSSDMDLPSLTVTTTWPDASAEMVERSITTRIEQAAATVTSAKKISSTSSEGNSQVTVEFQKKTDMDLARLELSEKMASLASSLPQGCLPPRVQKYIPKEFADLQGFMTFSLSSPAGLMFLQKYAQEKIRPALMQVSGVAEVTIQGAAEREIVMALDEGRLQAAGFDILQVHKALFGLGKMNPAGQLIRDGERRYVYIGNELKAIDDLYAVLLTPAQPGRQARPLSDFCRIRDTLATPTQLVRINGEPTLSISVDKEPGINMLKTATAVDEAIAHLAKTFPSGMEIRKYQDRSKDMRAEIHELSSKSLLSALFVLLILFLFFRDVPLSLTVFLSVLFSLAGAIVYLAVSGTGLNVITLSALALSFGIIIDNAIVIFENIQRQFETDPSLDPFVAIRSGVTEMRLPLLAATATTIGALLPVIFLPEHLRPYFIQFALTSAVALIFSYVVAMTFIPVTFLWYRQKRKKNDARTTSRRPTVAMLYRQLLFWLLNHRKTAIAVSILFIGLPVWLLPAKIEIEAAPTQERRQQMENNAARLYNALFANSFMTAARPYLDHILGGSSHLFVKYVSKGELWKFGQDTYVYAGIQAPPGTELERVDAFSRQVEAMIENNRSHIAGYTTMVTSRYAYIKIEFTPQQAVTVMPHLIKEQLTGLLAGTSGFSVSVSGFGPGFFSGGSASTASYSIRLLGYNYVKVKEIAAQIARVLSKNPRVANITIDQSGWQAIEYELVGDIHRYALMRYGIGIEEFMSGVAAKMNRSLERQWLPIADESVRFTMSLANAGNRQDSNDLDARELSGATIMIRNRAVPVGDIMTITAQPVMGEIKREDQQYSRTISYEFKGPFKLGERYINGILNSLRLPVGYEARRPDWMFTFGEADAIPMIAIALISILMVFMITASLYESLRKPFIILLSVPMSLAGLFLGFYLFDINFSRGGYAAVILLIGLSVNNGIILVDRIAHLAKGTRESLHEAIVLAVRQRTRPILITTLTTVAGFLPFVIKADAYSFWYSFSFAVICGLSVSTIMLLLVMPVLYRIFGGRTPAVTGR